MSDRNDLLDQALAKAVLLRYTAPSPPLVPASNTGAEPATPLHDQPGIGGDIWRQPPNVAACR